MSAVADRYRKLADQMQARIAAVPADLWSSPSPCEDWTARDVVKHLVETPAMFFGMIDQPAPSGGPSVEDDPLGAFVHVRQATEAALDDPAVAERGFDGFMGHSTFEQAIDRFQSADLVIHQWDLARAVGQDETLDSGEVHGLFEAMKPMDKMLRSPGAFGPKVEPPAGADEQTQLLCFLGRRV
jgi:TIGR03086 family protein